MSKFCPPTVQETMAGLVSYADLYEHTQLDDMRYNANLAQQIRDLVHIEPTAYDPIDMENIVDCVNELRDILACDTGYPVEVEHNLCPDLEFLLCEIDFSHFYPKEIHRMVDVHNTLRRLIMDD